MRRIGPAVLAVAPLVVVALFPGEAQAQVTAGPEFRVNTYTTDFQRLPDVAFDRQGGFVVTWDSYRQAGPSPAIFARRYDASGAPRGGEIQVSTDTANRHISPAVAADAQGDFVVAWQAFVLAGSYFAIVAQRFDAAGNRRGGEFQVNTYTTGAPYAPRVASVPDGRFVVVWADFGTDIDRDVFARAYDAAGLPLGPEFRVNTYTTGIQGTPAATVDGAGNFVVVWISPQDGSLFAVMVRRYDATGVPRGPEFQVNTYTTDAQFAPSVASDGLGGFVVAWTSVGQDESSTGIFARRFDAAGAPLGGEFAVNIYTPGSQQFPSVAADANGAFVVTWESDDGYDMGVFARRFDSAGAPRGGEFRVNSFTAGRQYAAAAAADVVGNFVVAWQGPDGDRSGVFGQRFGGLRPVVLACDPAPAGGTDGNSVIEPGETAVVAPRWRNLNGTAQAFTGAVSSFTGPAGASYTIADGAASYGSVPDGGTGDCLSNGDCYTLAVSAPPTRPAQHWDASFREDLAPAVQGQSKSWTLHIGGSFLDVSRSSAFYPFIESLLHHDVTGGCSGTDYCPLESTTRAQMSVFVLVSREGAAFSPPACVSGSEMFLDVPASNPFCRWIEELARRGVVGGCGGGNYCPSSPVTREQMSVFVLRTLDPTLNPPACTTPVFADVPATSPFCRWIEELARRGVVTGCGGGNYCPTSAVTREQMGVFISATFGLVLYGP